MEVLKILEQMIVLGFYTTEADLVEISIPVVDLLDGSTDFASQAELEMVTEFTEAYQNA